MSKAKKWTKYTLLILNVLIALSGIVILVSRSLFLHYKNDFLGTECFVSQDFISVIVFGALIKIFSLFGLYATAKEHRKLLILYSILMSALVIASLGTSYNHAIFREEKSDFNTCDKHVYFHELRSNSTNEKKRDLIQTSFKCCGWKSADDYLNKSGNLTLPLSCCKNQSVCSGNMTASSEMIFKDSCSSKLISNNKAWKITLYSILVTFSVMTFVSIWLSLYFAHLKNKKAKNRNNNQFRSTGVQFRHIK